MTKRLWDSIEIADHADRERRAVAALDAIDSGSEHVEITSADSPYFDYLTSSGWRFRVFFDCGDFDYVESFMEPGEDEWTDSGDDVHGLLGWRPARGRAWLWDPGRPRPDSASANLDARHNMQ